MLCSCAWFVRGAQDPGQRTSNLQMAWKLVNGLVLAWNVTYSLKRCVVFSDANSSCKAFEIELWGGFGKTEIGCFALRMTSTRPRTPLLRPIPFFCGCVRANLFVSLLVHHFGKCCHDFVLLISDMVLSPVVFARIAPVRPESMWELRVKPLFQTSGGSEQNKSWWLLELGRGWFLIALGTCHPVISGWSFSLGAPVLVSIVLKPGIWRPFILWGPQHHDALLDQEHCFFLLCHRLEVECDQFCQKVLRARMEEGCLPKVGISPDVSTFSPKGQQKRAKAICAGFPCQVTSLESFHGLSCWVAFIAQGISAAGRQGGLGDWRSALVKEIFRIGDECPELYRA